jgi:hypothetical protein
MLGKKLQKTFGTIVNEAPFPHAFGRPRFFLGGNYCELGKGSTIRKVYKSGIELLSSRKRVKK